VRHRVNGTATPLWRADLKRVNGAARGRVEELFLAAILTVESFDDRERRFFTVHSAWPKYAHDFWHAYQVVDVDEDEADQFTPTPHEIGIALDVMALGRGLDRVQWRIAADVAHGFSWEAIGVRRHMPAEAVQWHYGRALDMVTAAALRD